MRELRREAGISQDALGWEANVHPKHVSEIERCNKDPRISTVFRLAHALRTTADDLVGRCYS